MRNQTATMAAPMRPAMIPSRRYLDRESMRTLLSIEWGRGPSLLLFVYHRRDVTASWRDATQCPPRANASGSPSRRRRLRRLGGELHDHLAEIVSREEPEKGPRRVLEALHDGLLALEEAGGEPSSHLREKLRIEIQVVGDDEALHEHAIADHGEEGARPRIGRIEVVLRDHAAEGNAGTGIHEPQDGIQERTAHVLEIDVDAGGTGRAERLQEIARL